MKKDDFSLYIRNEATGTTINFDLVPEDFSESFSSSFESQDIMGRSAPIVGWSSSGPHSVSLTLTLHAEIEGGTDKLKDKINKLVALTYPVYSGDAITPPKCFIRVGKMVGMYGYIESVSVSWEKPYSEQIFRKAEVSIDVNEIANNASECLDAVQVEAGGLYQI